MLNIYRFIVQNHYWFVGNQSPSTQVYSSLVSGYVPITNPTYLAWVAAGGITTTISSDTSLNDVLLANNLTPIFPSPIITNIEFYNRFTPSETLAVSAASIANAIVHDFYMRLAIHPEVDLSNSVVQQGVNNLAQMGVITTDRALAILTP